MILNEKHLYNKLKQNPSKYDSKLLENRNFDINKKYDLFISHSFLDKELVEVLYKMFEECGYIVYIDWKEEKMQDRNNVSAITAKILKTRIDNCSSLAYIATKNITNSKWCPWELGYGDGKKGRAAILPILEEENNEYKGQEYLGIYPYIDYNSATNGKYEFWVNDPENKNRYNTLREWIRTGELKEHK